MEKRKKKSVATASERPRRQRFIFYLGDAGSDFDTLFKAFFDLKAGSLCWLPVILLSRRLAAG